MREMEGKGEMHVQHVCCVCVRGEMCVVSVCVDVCVWENMCVLMCVCVWENMRAVCVRICVCEDMCV